MRIAFWGNFGPSHSTESHLAASLESLGHRVTRLQEGRVRAVALPEQVEGHDLLLWVQTYSLANEGGTIQERADALQRVRAMGIPSVAFHLDLWHPIARAHQLEVEPFFHCDYVFTADGGHDEQWNALGINHFWSPPGVYHAECYDAEPQDRFRSDVAFVGSWESYGHPEHWPYRYDLLERLRGWYGERFKCWPEHGRPAVRGDALNALYASVKVVVGDSCLVGKVRAYSSDRVPETAGRGGFIIHPFVEGVLPGVFFGVPGWEAGDWDRLHELIEVYLADDCLRNAMRQMQARDVRKNHTYRVRAQRILDVVFAGSAAVEPTQAPQPVGSATPP